MQNSYAGDAGDFGKIGLLRSLSSNNLKVGVNWYLVFDEVHNGDGKHTGYLCNPKFVSCDDELLGKLGCMVYGNQRSISAMESMNLIANVSITMRNYCRLKLVAVHLGISGMKTP